MSDAPAPPTHDAPPLDPPPDEPGWDDPDAPAPVSAIRHIAASGHLPPLTRGRPKPADADGAQLEAELGRLSASVTHPAPSRGLRGAIRGLGIPVRPSAAEESDAAAEAARDGLVQRIRDAKWPRPVGILVANPRGGVGKTPTALLLGGVLAAARGGTVAVLEVTDDAGSLAYRAEGEPTRGVGELVRDAGEIRNAAQLEEYSVRQSSYAAVFGSAGPRRPLESRDVVRAANVLDVYYPIRVMDSGAQTSSSAFEGALSVTDALVIPVLNSADAVLSAVALLEQLRARDLGRLADGATIVRLSDGRPEQPAVVTRLDRLIADAGVAGTIAIPFDRHIAERGQLSLERLSSGSGAAFLRLGATVMGSLAGVR